jgi:hypothetical protein
MLWSLRTTPNAATQEEPLFLVHGAEAVLPIEITYEAQEYLPMMKLPPRKNSKMM